MPNHLSKLSLPPILISLIKESLLKLKETYRNMKSLWQNNLKN